jgi:ribosomal protection tetracycline resistance protein
VGSALRRAVGNSRLTPVFFGSAMTGAGVGCLLAELPRLVRAPCPPAGAPASAIVFKMQRAPTGEKIALARLFGGTLAVRDQITIRRPGPNGAWAEHAARVTGLEHLQGGAATAVASVTANDIARVHGPRDIRVGDVIGTVPAQRRPPRFPRPTLESVIRPRDEHDAGRMYAALTQLEEQDPLISIRRGEREATVSVRLYGEVQKEVIQATLADEFAVAVEFEPSQVICIERVIGRGEALEAIGDPDNPFPATVGLRIEPAAPGSGIGYHRELGALPLAFYRAIEETVFATLEEGLRGWPVPDCRVTLTRVGMIPITAAGDFRKLVPLVLMTALQAAGTQVCEPIVRFTLDLPPEGLGEAFVRLTAAGATTEETIELEDQCRVSGVMAAAAVDRFERQVPDLTSGRGVFRTEAAGHRPVLHDAPARRRTDFDPLHRKRYLALVSQH